jgi:hypothetical protein
VAAAAAAAAAGVRKAAGKMASVYIPVQGTEEEVRVALDQLPADASDILDILKAEQAPLHLWLIIAVRSPSLPPFLVPSPRDENHQHSLQLIARSYSSSEA